MHTHPGRNGSRADSGIALVIVLGILSMLMILAVGFFVAMRTERLAARSYADTVRAREMARTGIVRAVEAIDANIGDAPYPNWLTPGKEDILVSTGGFVIAAPSAPFISNIIGPVDTTAPTNVLNHVPGALQANAANAIPDVTWINVEKPLTTYSYQPRTLFGRYAFMAINVSGFIDPNRDYSPTNNVIFPRRDGFDANEIAYSNNMHQVLQELDATPANAVKLFTGRGPNGGRSKSYYRAENEVDLYMVGRFPSSYFGGTAPLTRTPYNLFPCSFFPLGFRDAAGAAQTNIYIGGTAANVEALRPQITTAFANMPGLAAGDANALARGLVDYLDSDFIPGGIDGGGLASGPNCDMVCNEAVPMLHQFHINTNIGSPSSGVTRVGVQIIAQVWYPFVAPTNNNAYSVKMDVSVDGNGYAGDGATSATMNLPTPANGWMAHSFATCTNTFWFQTSNTNATPTGLTIKELSVLQGTKVVDRIAGPDRTAAITPWTTYFADPGGGTAGSWWWAPEPRLNWLFDPAGNNQWVRGGLKGAGGPASWAGGNPNVPGEYPIAGGAGPREMYVRNRDQLRNVGELGLLAYESGARAVGEWKTIRLLGPDALPVFDQFTVQTNALTGIVNPNTLNRSSIAAMFLGAPVERFPGETNAVVNVGGATNAANRVMNAIVTTGLFANRSDIARTDLAGLGGTDFGLPAGQPLDRLQAEGVIRNTGQLFSTRQQLFLIIVRGQSVSDTSTIAPDFVVDENAGEVRGDTLAIALVWRDPYKVNGRHRTFIRWMKWLDML